jgi:hypothetical protein
MLTLVAHRGWWLSLVRLGAVLSVAMMKAPQRMAAALLEVHYKLQVAPRSVASPVAWARRLAAWTGSVAMMKAPQQMVAALLQVQYKLQVAPCSVASLVAWAVQALQGRWVVLALPEEAMQKPPPMAMPA